MKKRITIKKIAELAGVSYATANFVLNGRGREKRIKEETAEKILDIARENNFPLLSLSSKGLKKRIKIGVVIPGFSRQFMLPKLDFLRNQAVRLNIDLNVFFYADSPLEKIQQLRDIKYIVDGVILSEGSWYEDDIEEVKKLKLPAFSISSNLIPAGIDSIHIDIEKAIYNEVTHLVDQGYTEIYLCSSSDNRIEPFKNACQDLGLKFKTDWLLGTPFEKMNEAMIGFTYANYLKDKINLETAFMSNDQICMSFMSSIFREKNYLAPKDYGIAGFDNLNLAEFSVTPLTTVKYPYEYTAEKAFEVLLMKIENNNDVIYSETIVPELITRESTQRKHHGSSSKK